MHKYFALFILLFSSHSLSAQIFPQEGGKLCYRIIGFSFPAQEEAIKYKIEVAEGNYNSLDSFRNNIIIRLYTEKNKMIAEVPSFGSQYTWRVKYIGKDSSKIKSPLHHFSTKIVPDVDTSLMRMRVLQSAGKYKDAYVFLDVARVLYDMNGKPVWFLPGIDLERNKSAYPRDLKLTPQGTITFLSGFQPYEITYDGNLLWQNKINAATHKFDTFHHEFTRLANGHYMAMILVNEIVQKPAFKDSVAHNAVEYGRYNFNMQHCEIVEYDKNNQVIWRWSSKEYVQQSDLFLRKNEFGLPDNDVHANSFYFDEKSKSIYVSFRNINRVIKVKYPEGNVINTYGTIYKPGIANLDNNDFCGQHSVRLSRTGNLYLYNNNTCSSSHVPTIAMFQEMGNGKNSLKKIWEYQCTLNDLDTTKPLFVLGGSVNELPDESMFVSMGAPYCKMFIVNKDKKELWSAVYEKYNVTTKKWEMPDKTVYRASIITSRKELEQLIWNSEKDAAGTDL